MSVFETYWAVGGSNDNAVLVAIGDPQGDVRVGLSSDEAERMATALLVAAKTAREYEADDDEHP